MNKIIAKLPAWIKKALKKIVQLRYYGNARFCPLCKKTSSQFLPFGGGEVMRENAACPRCGSLERHRLLWLFLTKQTNLFDGRQRKMLHVAPEQCFEEKFRETVGSGYLTADLLNPEVMVEMDITDIQYPDESFDIICCSHVLEHVLDDVKAMREFYRVLKPDGWAILLVPIVGDETYEDASIVSPEARIKAFGQFDHVRIYGKDYVDRLQAAGFNVTTTKVCDLVDDEQAVKMGLIGASGDIFYCTK